MAQTVRAHTQSPVQVPPMLVIYVDKYTDQKDLAAILASKRSADVT